MTENETFLFEKDLYERIGSVSDHSAVAEALDHFWTVVSNKGLETEPNSVQVSHTKDEAYEVLVFVISWFEEPDPEEEDPDFLHSQITFTYMVDLKDETFNWTLSEEVSGGTGSVFDLEDEEDSEEFED